MPPRGGAPEIQSLSFQSNRISPSSPPCDKELDEVVSRVVQAYPTSTLPRWLVDGVVPSDEQVRGYFSHISGKASPGLPWAEFALSKKEILDKYSDMIVKLVQLRISLLTQSDVVESDPRILVKNFIKDPIRLCIKDEPHPIQKLIDGRYRLISSCSIVDEIIFGMVCGPQNEQEILFNALIPSKCGMGLTLDDQISDLWNYAEPWIDTATSSDVSGWDWCLDEWKMMLAVKSQILLTNGSDNKFYCRLLNNMAHCMMRSLFVTSSGRMFVLRAVGIMKSGFPITASWNSRIRCSLSYLVGSKACMTMGDDCNEATDLSPDELVARYASLGVRVTDVLPASGRSFSFCSHFFEDGKAIPENPWKPFFNLLNSDYNDPIYLSSFHTSMRNHPDYMAFVEAYHEVNKLASEQISC
jgi:hypothetical protein